MGEVIPLHAARGRGAHGAPTPRALAVAFAFDAASPWTYLAAERVERRFANVAWVPAMHVSLRAEEDGFGRRGLRRRVEARAAELGLPLVWPDGGPARTPAPSRVAAFAAERGTAAAFVLASGRLAYCGGFDLDDPEVLAEAAAAGGLALDEALAAARDATLDAGLARAATDLVRAGARELPLLDVGGSLFCGERGVAEAAAALRAGQAELEQGAC